MPADSTPKILGELTRKLETALGSDLISVVLYGSAAAGDHHANFSDYNVLCALQIIAPAQLRATETVFRWWRGEGNPAPLLLTEHELRTSTDCFAIEFHDIRESHKVLHGPNLVADLVVDPSFYRAQVEHDLRARLLRLRQKASGILSDKDVLRRLLVDSISTFCVLIRHALILHDAAPPATKREIVNCAGEVLGIDTKPFHTLLDCREERIKPQAFEPESLLGDYLLQIGRVIDAVDVISK